MPGINKVILIGRVKDAPQLHIDENIPHVHFELSTQEFVRKGQTQVEQTEYHQILMSQRLAELAARLLKKDMLIHVEGKLRTRSFRDGSIVRYVTEIIAQHFTLIGRSSDF